MKITLNLPGNTHLTGTNLRSETAIAFLQQEHITLAVDQFKLNMTG